MSERNISPLRGMRDFYPEAYTERETLFSLWKDQAKKYGFEFYDAPVVETLELLTRKAGEEIVDQIYSFEDKSGRELALRPEMTPSLTRMVLSKYGELKFPLRWSSIPQCFRYERSGTGRRREHYQWNVDILGEKSLAADAEVVAMGVKTMEQLGLCAEDVNVFFGSKKVLSELLTLFNIPEENYQSIFLAIDKRGKITDKAIKQILEERNISDDSINSVFRMLHIDSLEEVENLLGDQSEGIREIKEFLKYVDFYGVSNYLKFDIGIVRGLSYYTGIVFEAFDKEKKFRSIFGGGRYDNLFQSMGGVDIPAVGMGFGDVVIQDVLAYCDHKIEPTNSEVYVVVYTNPDLEAMAFEIASTLRSEGKNVLITHKSMKIKNGLRFANDKNAENIVIIDSREVQNGEYIVKNLTTGEQSLENIKRKS